MDNRVLAAFYQKFGFRGAVARKTGIWRLRVFAILSGRIYHCLEALANTSSAGRSRRRLGHAR
jgi:hypothetical protein